MHFKSLIAGGALAFAATGAFAQDYPNRPVTVIVPYVAGGPSHLSARIYGEFFARTLGQQFVIEHEVGAGAFVVTVEKIETEAEAFAAPAAGEKK
jgi:tripartite-type tricarboxylate transporter receptor subunit TctC